jgi:hypothetical protein
MNTMDITNISTTVATLLSVIGLLVAITNIITEVLKKVTWEKIPTQILALLISEVLTLIAFFAFMQIKGITILWYMIAAAVVVGLLVAYAAMFGFEKLKEILVNATKKDGE